MTDKNVVSLRESDGSIVKLEINSGLASTAALAREYAALGYPDRYVVFSDKRIYPKNDKKNEDMVCEGGMFMSIILRPSIFPSQASLLGAMSATALISALEEHTKMRLGLGWVGDLYCEGVKIGGSSVEGKLDDFTAYEYIIVTFQARLDNHNFPPRLTDMVRKVFESENTSISMIIARNVLSKFFKLYSKIKSPSKFMDIYSEKFALRGVKIKFGEDQRKKSCKVLGINKKNGALIAENRRGEVIEITSQRNVVIPKKIKLTR